MNRTPLDTESASPLYRQLMKKLRGEIAAGIYPVHSRIPSEQELCDAYDVSRVTVRKALDALTREGLLERRQGKGTFVSIPRIRKDLKVVNSFHDSCRMMGCEPQTRVIRAELRPAGEDDCARLMVGEGDQVVEIVRLCMADKTPVMLETNHFSTDFAWLLEKDLGASLYAALRENKIEPAHAIHEVSLCYAEGSEARLLELNAGEALLCLNETIFDENGRPLHTSVQKIRGDRFTFRI